MMIRFFSALSPSDEVVVVGMPALTLVGVCDLDVRVDCVKISAADDFGVAPHSNTKTGIANGQFNRGLTEQEEVDVV